MGGDERIEIQHQRIGGLEIIHDDGRFLLVEGIYELAGKDGDIPGGYDPFGLEISAGEILEHRAVDILGIIAVLHVLDEHLRSLHDIASGSHEHAIDVLFHRFQGDKDFSRIGFGTLRHDEIRDCLELASVIGDEPGILDESVILRDLIGHLDDALRRLLDIFDIGGADGHIVFVIDVAGIVRQAQISGVLLELGVRERIIAEIIDDALDLAHRDDVDARARQDERIEQIEDDENEKHFESEDHIEDIVLLGIYLQVEFLDIEKEVIGQPEIFDDLMLLLVLNIEAEAGEEIFGFFGLGDEKSIEILLLEQFLDLLAPPLVVEERMFRIDIDIDSPAVGDFLYGFEYFV